MFQEKPLQKMRGEEWGQGRRRDPGERKGRESPEGD